MSLDGLRRASNCMRWSRLDPDKPPGIHLPKRHGDVGWDLEAMEDVVIPPMQARDVPVNARLELPVGTWGEIRSRSSIARRNLQVDAGTLDNGYRGPLYVLVRNMQLPTPDDPDPFTVIKAGERVGQLVFYRMAPVWAEEVPEIDLNTDRSEAGFGSTGR